MTTYELGYPPLKRPRMSQNGSAFDLSAPTIADKEFWFNDGNLILVAQGIGFKVYKDLLAEQSPIFADMLAASSPSASDTFCGSPIVRLSDSAQDLRHLLGVLLPKRTPIFYYTENEFKFTFEQVSAIIRLAHKYRIEALLEQGLNALKNSFPDTFDDYESDTFNTLVEYQNFQAISAVALARLTDTPSILPYALYTCCGLKGMVIDGSPRVDGWIEQLGTDDLKRCINGRDRLARENTAFLFRVFVRASPIPQCLTPKQCRHALPRIATTIGEHEEAGSYDMLASWGAMIKMHAKLLGLCDKCEDDLLTKETAARRGLWDKLPNIFDLQVEQWGSQKSVDGGVDDDVEQV